jgi:hypothetical protein
VSRLSQTFEAAREATKAAFHIRLIGTFEPDLVCAPAEAKADAWLADAQPDFDQFPVREADRTIGLLLRGPHAGRPVRDAMLPLSEELIASADMPIVELIPRMKTLPYRLILRGNRIDGIVTPMADLVTTHWPDGTWADQLSPGRQTKLLEKEAALRRRGMNPPRIELTEFSDKRDLCKRLLSTGRRRFDQELDGLRDLRDQLAHAATFLDDVDEGTGISSFVDKCEAARHWLRELMTLNEKASATGTPDR